MRNQALHFADELLGYEVEALSTDWIPALLDLQAYIDLARSIEFWDSQWDSCGAEQRERVLRLAQTIVCLANNRVQEAMRKQALDFMFGHEEYWPEDDILDTIDGLDGLMTSSSGDEDGDTSDEDDTSGEEPESDEGEDCARCVPFFHGQIPIERSE
ncbi:MAG TPA: hypothetical protein PLV25_06915 [Opitutales bacterium]|nr:hypothetical protein [Opitutales bacterium]